MIDIDYEVLPASGDCRAALRDSAAVAHSSSDNNACAKYTVGYGDLAAAFGDGARIFTASLR